MLQGGRKVRQPKVNRFSILNDNPRWFISTYFILNMYANKLVNIVFDGATLGVDDLMETLGDRSGRGAQVVDVLSVLCLEQEIFLER